MDMLPYESMNRTQIWVIVPRTELVSEVRAQCVGRSKVGIDAANGDIAHGFLGNIAPVYT